MYKRILASLGATLLVTALSAQYRTGSYRELFEDETSARLRGHIEYLASDALDGRAPGSEGERLAAAYLTEKLQSYGAEVISGAEGDLFGLKTDSDTLTSRNVLAVIPGADPALRDHYIVVGARMDNLGSYDMTVNGETVHKVFPGAVGGASGMTVLLELARKLSEESALLGRSVILAGFGASEVSGAGSWYLLNRSWPDVSNLDAMVALESLGAGPSAFYAYTCSNKDMDAISAVLSGKLLPIRAETVSSEPLISDHRSFYEKDIPTVLFTSGIFPEYNTVKDVPSNVDLDALGRETEYIFRYVLDLSTAEKPRFRLSDPLPDSSKRENVLSFYECDQRPTFLGSANPETFLTKWVYQYLRYPDSAVKEGVQGNVTVDFIIDSSGKVKDVKILRSPDERLSKEVVRVVSASPSWKPGRSSGRKVATELSLTVEFRLEKRGSFGINGARIK